MEAVYITDQFDEWLAKRGTKVAEKARAALDRDILSVVAYGDDMWMEQTCRHSPIPDYVYDQFQLFVKSRGTPVSTVRKFLKELVTHSAGYVLANAGPDKQDPTTFDQITKALDVLLTDTSLDGDVLMAVLALVVWAPLGGTISRQYGYLDMAKTDPLTVWKTVGVKNWVPLPARTVVWEATHKTFHAECQICQWETPCSDKESAATAAGLHIKETGHYIKTYQEEYVDY